MISLSDETVHLWQVNLDRPPIPVTDLLPLLAPDEQAKAQRLRTAELQARSIASRGLLRVLLSRYLAIAPDQVAFSYGPYGKPGLDLPTDRPLQFNLAHSQELALYAFTWDHLIGIDLEKRKPVDDPINLAKRFFTAREAADLVSTPPAQQTERFLQYWTCKEAYLKAIGRGLGGLAEVEVALTEVGSATLIRVAESEEADWSLQLFRPTPDSIAALAIQASSQPVIDWQHFE